MELLALLMLSMGMALGQKNTIPACNGQLYQRKSLHSMSQAEIDNFVQAVYKVNNAEDSAWNRFATLHAQIYPQVHVNPKFLPWHRAFVWLMEQQLQTVSPGVTIPYWDWATYSQNPENDPIFTDRIAGGDGDPNNSDCIKNGQFAKLQVKYATDPNSNTRCIKRRMAAKDANGLVWTSPDTLDRNTLNSKSFKEFAESLEQGSHGIIHNCIGSEFAGHASPNDPVFFLHHSFIDKLWYDWQKRNPSVALDYSSDPNEILEPFGISVSQVLDASKLCYSYPEDKFRWNVNNGGQPSATVTNAATAPTASSQPIFNNNVNNGQPSAITTNAFTAPALAPVPSDQPIHNGNVNNDAANPVRSQVNEQFIQPTPVAPLPTAVPFNPNQSPITTTTTILPPNPQTNGTLPNSRFDKRTYNVLVPEQYQSKCRSATERAKYDAWYVTHDINAPSAGDRTDLTRIRVPTQLTDDFIKKWGYDHKKVRQMERQVALWTNEVNNDPSHVSPAALINFPKFNPKLKKEGSCGCNKNKTQTAQPQPTGYYQ